MKEAHVQSDASVTLHDVAIPEMTDPHHVLVKVVVSGCNPKDWKMPAGILKTIGNCPNSGDDIAGYVHAVGTAVTAFHPGDRVASLHQLGAPHGSYAEYALVWDHMTFHLPHDYPFEKAATLPMGLFMASVGLFAMLQAATTVWEPLSQPRPLLIYGAASVVGAYAVKLAQVADIHPLICIAGRSRQLVESIIDPQKGDVVLDYRKGDEALVEDIRQTLNGRKLEYAFDCVSQHTSTHNICQVLDRETGTVSLVLPSHSKEVPEGVKYNVTMVGSLWPGFDRKEGHGQLGLGHGGENFGAIMSTLLTRWIAAGDIAPHPYKVVPGGLTGIETALKSLREGKNAGTKYVVRIAETPGLLD